jgi:apolipoprotein N-acyltransferase
LPAWLAPAAAAAASGALTALAFPPWNLWPLVLVGLAPVIWLAWRQPPRRAALWGWVWGLALETARLPWLLVVLTVYGQVSWPLAVLALLLLAAILALYPAAFALLVAYLRAAGVSPLASTPLAWAGLAWLRGWLFTGFPWLPLGAGLIPALPLIQSAEWWGAGGLGALIALVNALVARAGLGLAARRAGWREAACLAAACALVAAGWLAGSARLETVDREAQAAPRLATSVVQANVPLAELWDPALRRANLDKHLELTREAAAGAAGRPWLVVWSESSAPFYFLAPERPTAPVLEAAAELDAWLLTGTLGSVERGGRRQPTNRSWLVGPDGRPAGFYDKVHLVPFGEYVPLEEVLFFVRAVAVMGESFAPGERGAVLEAAGVPVGPLICYESIFPELARSQAARGARLLVNQTNDAWYGRTAASAQHLSHLCLRAVENRRAVARAGNTGISGFVLPTGRVVQTIGIFQAGHQTRELPLMEMETFYTSRGGLVGPWGLVVTLLAALGAAWRRRRRRR